MTNSGKWKWNMEQPGIDQYFLDMMRTQAELDVQWYTLLCHLAEAMV